MIDAQSIVVAGIVTGYVGHEGEILRYVFWHSVALACLVGILVTICGDGQSAQPAQPGPLHNPRTTWHPR